MLVRISGEFALVIAVVIASVVVVNWLGIAVSRARRRYDVPYPTMYADRKQPLGHIFNCYQRAHQNLLEWLPIAFSLLIIGGLRHPRIAAVGGLIWLAGRVVFARGYMTGDPKKRRSGEFDLIGLFVMLFANFSFIRWLLFGTTE